MAANSKILCRNCPYDKVKFSSLPRKNDRNIMVRVLHTRKRSSLRSARTLSDGSTYEQKEMAGGESVEVITDNGGGKLYLIGTDHVSRESMEAVNKLLTDVKPQIVVIEMCPARAGLTDSKIFIGDDRRLNYRVLLDAVNEIGFFPAMIFYSMAYTQDFLSRTLQVDYGADLRAAIKNPPTTISSSRSKQRNYKIMLGDRPIEVTFKRLALALNAGTKVLLTVFSTLIVCFGWSSFLVELSPKFTTDEAFKNVLVRERDIYLTHSLKRAVCSNNDNKPIKVVGVVGCGHVAGIIGLWGSVTDEHVAELMNTERL